MPIQSIQYADPILVDLSINGGSLLPNELDKVQQTSVITLQIDDADNAFQLDTLVGSTTLTAQDLGLSATVYNSDGTIDSDPNMVSIFNVSLSMNPDGVYEVSFSIYGGGTQEYYSALSGKSIGFSVARNGYSVTSPGAAEGISGTVRFASFNIPVEHLIGVHPTLTFLGIGYSSSEGEVHDALDPLSNMYTLNAQTITSSTTTDETGHSEINREEQVNVIINNTDGKDVLVFAKATTNAQGDELTYGQYAALVINPNDLPSLGDGYLQTVENISVAGKVIVDITSTVVDGAFPGNQEGKIFMHINANAGAAFSEENMLYTHSMTGSSKVLAHDNRMTKITATAFDDVIEATGKGGNVQAMSAGDGNDIIVAGGENVLVIGGNGADTIYLGTGKQYVAVGSSISNPGVSQSNVSETDTIYAFEAGVDKLVLNDNVTANLQFVASYNSATGITRFISTNNGVVDENSAFIVLDVAGVDANGNSVALSADINYTDGTQMATNVETDYIDANDDAATATISNDFFDAAMPFYA